MKQEYRDWINKWLESNNPRGLCYSASRDIISHFPLLRQERGFVRCDSGFHEHWWCVDTDGSVVDPTASQFNNIMEYVPYEEGMEVRIGRCMNCGDDIYDNTMKSKKKSWCCSDECEEILAEEYG